MKKVLIVLLVLLVILQFFKIDKTNPPVEPGMDFLVSKSTPQREANLIRSACYDCHSHETTYPWYADVQPMAWLLEKHIKVGRKKFNFSTFATYGLERQAHKLEEAAELVESGDMPMESYLLGHPEAKLTQEDRDVLIAYFKTMQAEISTQSGAPR